MLREGIVVEVHVSEPLSPGGDPDRIRRAVESALCAEGVAAAEISIALLPDAEIAKMNLEHLGHSGATDVISFALHSPGEPPLGDVYIGAEQAERQAVELGVPLDEELLRLALHGTLHVLGYDHPEGEERYQSPMYARQEELLTSFLAPDGGSPH